MLKYFLNKFVMAQTLACLYYFLSGGAIVIGVCSIIESVCASYLISQLFEYSFLTPSNICGPAIMLLVMGLITCLIAWCIWKFVDFTNRGQVIIFSTALMIVIIINMSAGIWALIRHEQVDLLAIAHHKHVFELAVSENHTDLGNINSALWDQIHSELHCCGINGPTDYLSKDAVPWSCCVTSSLTNTTNSKGICITMYARGCQYVIINRIRSILLHIFLLALFTVLLQICFMTCMLCYERTCRERMKRRKKLITLAQSFAQASKDLGTNDNILNQQSKYSKILIT